LDMVLANASILTFDAFDRFVSRGHLIIRKDKIADIIAGGDIPPGPATGCVVDAANHLVLPGFVNCHTHCGETFFRGLCDDGTLFPWLQQTYEISGRKTVEERRASYEQGCREMVRSGVTCLCDSSEPLGVMDIIQRSGLRYIAAPMLIERMPWGQALPESASRLESRIGLLSEFSGRQRTSVMLGAHAIYSCSAELLGRAKRYCDAEGIIFCIHLAESADEVDFSRKHFGTSPVSYLHRLGLLDGNTLAFHCVHFDEPELELLRERGVSVVHCPIANLKLYSGVAPVADLIRSGVPVGLGTDGVMTNNSYNFFEELKFAVLLARLNKAAGRAELTAHEAARAATIEGARVLGLGHEIGSIEVGKKADLQMIRLPRLKRLDREVAESFVVFGAGPQDVAAVICDGELILDARSPCGTAERAAQER